MTVTPLPELTTALSNVGIFLLALISAIYLYAKDRFWSLFFFAVAGNGLFGAVIHGIAEIRFVPQRYALLWIPMSGFLCMLGPLFLMAESKRTSAFRDHVLPIVAVTVLLPELLVRLGIPRLAATMGVIFPFLVWGILLLIRSCKNGEAGAKVRLAGILIFALGGLVDIPDFELGTPVFIDENGICHLILISGMAVLLLGILRQQSGKKN